VPFAAGGGSNGPASRIMGWDCDFVAVAALSVTAWRAIPSLGLVAVPAGATLPDVHLEAVGTAVEAAGMPVEACTCPGSPWAVWAHLLEVEFLSMEQVNAGP